MFSTERGDAAMAIDPLQAAIPYEVGHPAAVFMRCFGALYLVVSDPVGTSAHLQLGRAYALLGDKTRAKSAYQDFLTLWKDADTDIPHVETSQSRIQTSCIEW